MKGLISGIKRMEIHDGDGLRTTVFLKGCPLKCVWCHNPESISFEKQVAFFKDKCIQCGICKNEKNENLSLKGNGWRLVTEEELERERSNNSPFSELYNIIDSRKE